jgi:hypothetical protein
MHFLKQFLQITMISGKFCPVPFEHDQPGATADEKSRRSQSPKIDMQLLLSLALKDESHFREQRSHQF